MSEIAVGYVSIVPKFSKGFQSGIAKELGAASGAGSQAGKKVGTSFGSMFKATLASGAVLGAARVFTGAVGKAVGAFAGMVPEAVAASDATDKFKNTLKFADVGDKDISRLSKSTKAYADQTVYELSDIQSVTAQLAANNVKGYDKMAEAIGNVNAVAGGSAETFGLVSQAVTQVNGNGKLMTEDWNQIASAIPGASGKLQAAMKKNGAYTGNFRDAMAAGEITAEEMNQAFMDLGMTDVATEAAKSTKTIEGAFGNFKATVLSGLMEPISALKPAITTALGGLSTMLEPIFAIIADKAKAMAPTLTKLAESFANWAEGFDPTKLVNGFTGISGVLGTVKSALSGINFGPIAAVAGSAIGGLMSKFSGFGPILTKLSGLGAKILPSMGGITGVVSKLGSAFKLATGPVGLIVAALATAYATSEPFRNAINGLVVQIGGLVGQLATALMPVLTNLATTLGPIVGQIFTTIGTAITQVATALAPVITAIASALVPVISTLISAIMPLIASVLPPLLGALTGLVSSVLGAVLPALTQLVQVFSAVLVPVINTLAPIVQTIFGAIAATIKNVVGVIQGVIQVFGSALSGDWSGVWNGIKKIFSSVWNQIKNIASTAISIVRQVFGNGFNAVKNTISGILNGIVSFVKGIPGKFSTGLAALSNLAGKAAGWFGGFVRSARDKFGQAVDFVKGIPGKIGGYLSGLGSRLVASGKSLISGFIDGIKQGFSNAMGVVSDGLAKVRSFFPFSPAKRGPFSGSGYTTYSGQALMRDFGAGMTKGATKAAAAATAAQQRISDSLTMDDQDAYNYGINGTASRRSGAAARLGAVTHNWNITVPKDAFSDVNKLIAFLEQLMLRAAQMA